MPEDANAIHQCDLDMRSSAQELVAIARQVPNDLAREVLLSLV